MCFEKEVLRTLLYYDIWSHPLTEDELFLFLPVNSITIDEFRGRLQKAVGNTVIQSHRGFYFLKGKTPAVIEERLKRMRHARRMWLMARIAMHIIKRFPFVRAVFVSGDLSKNVTHRKSDVDFFIVTEPGRLWISRTLLTIFKKTFLLNRKKYFCINSFIVSDNLATDDRNIYVATEIATLKPLYNSTVFLQYLKANAWVNGYFPNFDIRLVTLPECNERPSAFQRLIEWPFRFIDADRLDAFLMHYMQRIWRNRYPQYDEETRSRIFRCTRGESRAYAGNFQELVLALYEHRLRTAGLDRPSRSGGIDR